MNWLFVDENVFDAGEQSETSLFCKQTETDMNKLNPSV